MFHQRPNCQGAMKLRAYSREYLAIELLAGAGLWKFEAPLLIGFNHVWNDHGKLAVYFLFRFAMAARPDQRRSAPDVAFVLLAPFHDFDVRLFGIHDLAFCMASY